MRELALIGIGTGNPDHLTAEARKAIASADLILVPHKGAAKSDLADLRHLIIDAVRPDAPVARFDMPVRDPNLPYLQAVDAWHHEIAQVWHSHMGGAAHVALLVWGDPSLYDSSLRIAARLPDPPQIRVIAGITSIQALTAAHGIALNTLAGAVTITTGRRLRDLGWPPETETLVVMLDGTCAFETLNAADYEIWWGAYLGMEAQTLHHGPLKEVQDRIRTTRAALRQEMGWIMDTYMLRRLSPP